MSSGNPIEADLQALDRLLRGEVTPRLGRRAQARILDLACGRCDEAETLIHAVKDQTMAGSVSLVGADIRIREILQARERGSKLPAEFLLEDATRLSHHKELGDDFDLVFLRHQNYWHDRETWRKIFDQGLDRLNENGLLVITSYFDKEHELALDALRKLGAEILVSKRNKSSRALPDAPGKSVDRWLAVARLKK